MSTAPGFDPSKFLVPDRGNMEHDNSITNFRQIGKMLPGVVSVQTSKFLKSSQQSSPSEQSIRDDDQFRLLHLLWILFEPSPLPSPQRLSRRSQDSFHGQFSMNSA
jgi:hypothetical protein